MSKTYTLPLLCLLFISLPSCFNTETSPEQTEHFSASPITEIQERLPLSLIDAFDKVALVLSKYGMAIPDGLSEDRKFTTTSLRIKDTMCKAQFLNRAPVSCELRFHGKFEPINENTTRLNLQYREYCAGQNHIPIVCKDSNAERLLFTVHKDIAK